MVSLKRHSLRLLWRLLLTRSDYVMLSTKVTLWHTRESEKVRIFVPFGKEAVWYQPANIISSCLFSSVCYPPNIVCWIIDPGRLMGELWRPSPSCENKKTKNRRTDFESILRWVTRFWVTEVWLRPQSFREVRFNNMAMEANMYDVRNVYVAPFPSIWCY